MLHQGVPIWGIPYTMLGRGVSSDEPNSYCMCQNFQFKTYLYTWVRWYQSGTKLVNFIFLPVCHHDILDESHMSNFVGYRSPGLGMTYGTVLYIKKLVICCWCSGNQRRRKGWWGWRGAGWGRWTFSIMFSRRPIIEITNTSHGFSKQSHINIGWLLLQVCISACKLHIYIESENPLWNMDD